MTNVKLYKSGAFVTTCHIIALCQYIYAVYYDCYHVIIPDHIQMKMFQKNFGGKSRFLTYWCLVSKCAGCCPCCHFVPFKAMQYNDGMLGSMSSLYKRYYFIFFVYVFICIFSTHPRLYFRSHI